MARTKELTGDRSLAPVFARAVLSGSGRKGGGLPDLEVTQRGIVPDVDTLAAYDRVCGIALRDTLPSTYLWVLSFPLQVTLFADKAYRFPMLGSVHLENRITQHRPVHVGEAIDLAVKPVAVTPHRRGATVDVAGTAHVAGELVWECVSTYLYRGAKVPGELPERIEWPEAANGPGATWRVPADLGRRYAAAAGDLNPIHLSKLSAKALGFPRAIAHGMWGQARIVGALENRLPEAYETWATFAKPVMLPSTVRFIANQEADSGAWDVAIRDARKDTVLVRGGARALVG